MPTNPERSSQSLLIAVVPLLLTQIGCLSWFSDKVATGTARLTIRNVAAMISAVNLDETCGFANNQINESPVIEGEVGGIGSGTWSVENCTLDYGDVLTTLSTDCGGGELSVKGALTISVEKVIHGRVTGNPEKPIIPFDSEAVTFRITRAAPQGFVAKNSASESWMQMNDGTLSANVSLKLAQADSNGLCSVVTPNAQITDVIYSPSEVHVHTPDNSFDLQIESSNLTAVNGVYGERENYLGGTLTIFGEAESVPMKGDDDGLDPEYNAARFKENYECTNDILLPESHSCGLTERIGEAVARLGIRNFGTLVKHLSSNTDCGFESPAVKASPELYGATGYDGGQATYTMENCRVHFPQETTLFTDCMGTIISVHGTAIVSGTKVVSGYLTGDPETPIVPSSSTPATISIDAELRNFKVMDSSSLKTLTVKTGNISGSLTPKTMIDTSTGACSIPTSHSQFTNIQLSNATVRLNSTGNLLDARVKQANLEAVNGVFKNRENYLKGSIIIDNEAVAVPLDPTSDILNPDYHPLAFIESFDCAPGAIIPETEEDCSFSAVLAQGAARLLVKNFGVVTKTVDLDSECGFGNTMEALAGLINTDVLSSYTDGSPYTATWDVNTCNLNHGSGDSERPGYALEPVLVESDCDGTNLMLRGQATVSAVKHVRGSIVVSYPPLHPQDRQSAQVRHSEIVFDEFAAYEVNEGQRDPAGPYLILHNGTMRGFSNPVTGESASSPGAYFIKTPVTGFENISIQDADATLVLGKKTFHFTLNESNLTAFNGSFNGYENFLHGTITFNGQRIGIPVTPEEEALDPDYSQEAFDQTYACKEDLKETVPYR